MNNEELITVREEYIAKIKAELLGPGSEIIYPDPAHELISTSPLTRYSLGILYPKDNSIGKDSDEVEIKTTSEAEDGSNEIIENNDLKGSINKDNFEEELNENNLDDEVALATQNLPSSMGMTFFINKKINDINFSVSFATYRKCLPTERRIPFFPENKEAYELPSIVSTFVKFNKKINYLELLTGELEGKWVKENKEKLNDDLLVDALYKLCHQKEGYIREPHSIDVKLSFSDKENYVDRNRNLDGTDLKITALRREINKAVSITVMLVNDAESKQRDVRYCYFQPEIKVSTDNNEFSFVTYGGDLDFDLLDDEEKSLELQYRNKRNFANGLGVATNWKIDSENKGEIYTDFYPSVEVPSMDFRLPQDSSVDESKALSMKYLSDLVDISKDEKISHLESVVHEYERWIEKITSITNELDAKYKKIGKQNIEACSESAKRMKKGLEILKNNDKAWTSFLLANRAMFMQRAHLKIQSDTSNIDRFPGDIELNNLLSKINYNTIDNDPNFNPSNKEKYSWRTFQIAFLLLSIESITDEKCKDRNIVDLIWFPTGGGKTEAYLGLTAFSIFYRRINSPNCSNGTTVIMRYTLRLLAAQQFTRAATLICACEIIRQENTKLLGKQEINIGLWIGGEHTPNNNKEAKDHLLKLEKANQQSIKYVKEEHNKFQVLKCPWCGTKLVKEPGEKGLKGKWGYFMEDGSHFRLVCNQDRCNFSMDHLPIQIVDEELYKNPPSLLFGTVDKFAMMPWNENTKSFFAIGTNDRPPELIIQDELHLISGPLGTMVGLFETVLDIICKEKKVLPKVVASTATIRRAKEQCGALYNRDVAQFPAPGIDSEDSFFARESVIDYANGIFGRKYVGIMPSGKTKAMMEIRSIAALLQIVKEMNLSDEVRDKFWTLTTYFNSLKDLGKCTNLVEDDVKDFIKRMVFRTGTANNARVISVIDELTSRVSTTDLNETLDKLEKTEYSKENIEKKKYASNIVLATNMISVGIDIARLNVMLMVGQPKLTSEYIQASSRVGRRWPGVVFTDYDASKSRDRSYYEQFKPYHESFYKYVEPTGATPFSKPARDRALHAVVISILRLLEPTLTGEKDARNFEISKYKSRIDSIKSQIIQRNKEVMEKIYNDIEDTSLETEKSIDDILTTWEARAEVYRKNNGNFYYGGGKLLFGHPEQNEGRLMKSFNTSPEDEAFDTMTSMRNVDSSVKGNVLIWKED